MKFDQDLEGLTYDGQRMPGDENAVLYSSKNAVYAIDRDGSSKGLGVFSDIVDALCTLNKELYIGYSKIIVQNWNKATREFHAGFAESLCSFNNSIYGTGYAGELKDITSDRILFKPKEKSDRNPEVTSDGKNLYFLHDDGDTMHKLLTKIYMGPPVFPHTTPITTSFKVCSHNEDLYISSGSKVSSIDSDLEFNFGNRVTALHSDGEYLYIGGNHLSIKRYKKTPVRVGPRVNWSIVEKEIILDPAPKEDHIQAITTYPRAELVRRGVFSK